MGVLRLKTSSMFADAAAIDPVILAPYTHRRRRSTLKKKKNELFIYYFNIISSLI